MELEAGGGHTYLSRSNFHLDDYATPPIQMEGGMIFHFVTGGIHEALDRAHDAANGMDVRIGGADEHYPAISLYGASIHEAVCRYLAGPAGRGRATVRGD